MGWLDASHKSENHMWRVHPRVLGQTYTWPEMRHWYCKGGNTCGAREILSNFYLNTAWHLHRLVSSHAWYASIPDITVNESFHGCKYSTVTASLAIRFFPCYGPHRCTLWQFHSLSIKHMWHVLKTDFTSLPSAVLAWRKRSQGHCWEGEHSPHLRASKRCNNWVYTACHCSTLIALLKSLF